MVRHSDQVIALSRIDHACAVFWTWFGQWAVDDWCCSLHAILVYMFIGVQDISSLVNYGCSCLWPLLEPVVQNWRVQYGDMCLRSSWLDNIITTCFQWWAVWLALSSMWWYWLSGKFFDEENTMLGVLAHFSAIKFAGVYSSMQRLCHQQPRV